MNLENLKMECECGGRLENINTDFKGIPVRGWKCKKCGEELMHPTDAQKALEIERARKNNELTVKLRKVGKSNIVTIPQTIMKLENFRSGQKLKWDFEGDKLVLSP